MKIQRDWFHGDMISSGIQWVTPQNWISTDPPWDQVFCMVGSDMFQKSPKKKNVSPVLSNYLYGVSKEERPTVNGAFSNKKNGSWTLFMETFSAERSRWKALNVKSKGSTWVFTAPGTPPDWSTQCRHLQWIPRNGWGSSHPMKPSPWKTMVDGNFDEFRNWDHLYPFMWYLMLGRWETFPIGRPHPHIFFGHPHNGACHALHLSLGGWSQWCEWRHHLRMDPGGGTKSVGIHQQ